MEGDQTRDRDWSEILEGAEGAEIVGVRGKRKKKEILLHVCTLGIVVLEISTVNKCDDLYSVPHENCLTKQSKMFHCMFHIIVQF